MKTVLGALLILCSSVVHSACNARVVGSIPGTTHKLNVCMHYLKSLWIKCLLNGIYYWGHLHFEAVNFLHLLLLSWQTNWKCAHCHLECVVWPDTRPRLLIYCHLECVVWPDTGQGCWFTATYSYGMFPHKYNSLADLLVTWMELILCYVILPSPISPTHLTTCTPVHWFGTGTPCI
jgi:hypothetical protein